MRGVFVASRCAAASPLDREQQIEGKQDQTALQAFLDDSILSFDEGLKIPMKAAEASMLEDITKDA